MTDAASRSTPGGRHRNNDDSPGTVYEQALAFLQPKIRALDFEKVASLFGAVFIGPDKLEIKFLNENYRITKERILGHSRQGTEPWISILIYNHLCMPDPPPPAGEWITFGSVPASHAKDKAWAGHVEEVIAKHFTGKVDALKAACERLGGNYSGRYREITTLPMNSDSSLTIPRCCCSMMPFLMKIFPRNADCFWTRPRRVIWTSNRSSCWERSLRGD